MSEIPREVMLAAQHAAFPHDDDEALVSSIAISILAERKRCKMIAIGRIFRADADIAKSKTDTDKMFYSGAKRASEAISNEIGLA